MKGWPCNTDSLRHLNNLSSVGGATAIFQSYERLVSKEAVVLPWWRSKTVKFGIRQFDQGQISTVKG